MQKPNYPNFVYSLQASPGKAEEGVKVRVTKVPARYNAKTVSTLSGRLLKLEKFGKVEIYAQGAATLILTAWVHSSSEIQPMVEKLKSRIVENLKYRMDELAKQISGTEGDPQVEHRDYAD